MDAADHVVKIELRKKRKGVREVYDGWGWGWSRCDREGKGICIVEMN